MHAQLAVQSIAWGHRPLEEILRDAKAAGFAGVELFQHPSDLGGPRGIVNAFDRFGMQLVGITSGSFDDRCAFVRNVADLRG
jgi:sugar phosphate isomerase/epimerase